MLENLISSANTVQIQRVSARSCSSASGGHCHDFFSNGGWSFYGNTKKGFSKMKLKLLAWLFESSSHIHTYKWQEVNDIRSIAIRLVSHLAQLPSSVMHFRDVLLAMPLTHRQQLQVPIFLKQS